MEFTSFPSGRFTFDTVVNLIYVQCVRSYLDTVTYLNDLKTIGFINNFGQTPKQLFRKPHPAKRWVVGSASMTAVDHADNSSTHTPVSTSEGSASYSKLFFHNLTNLRPSVAPIKELKGPVGQIQHIDRVVLAVEQVLLHSIFQNVS